MRKSYNSGFTLVEMMIVVAIIAITLSIAIPSYMTIVASFRRTACIHNLKEIQSAVEQYTMAHGISHGARITSAEEDDIYGNYIRGGRPTCSAGGEYLIEPIGSNPLVRCTREDDGHVLQ